LKISARWAELLSVNVSKLMIKLSDAQEKELCSASLVDGVPHLLRQSDELERLEDGLAVACHALPENAELRLRVKVQRARDEVILGRTWKIETADVSSGDAQGRIMFLPTDYNSSELQRLHGNRVSHIVSSKQLEDRLVAKEVTIFDADDSDQPPMDIRVNGFELDKSGDLREVVQAFLQQLQEGAKETYVFQKQTMSINTCFVVTKEDLNTWLQAAKNHSEGKMSPTQLPCPLSSFSKDRTTNMDQNDSFLSFGQACMLKTTVLDQYEMDCNETVEPDHVPSRKLELPVKVEFATNIRTTPQQIPRPQLGLLGVQLAITDPATRDMIMKSLLSEEQRIGTSLVKIANPVEARAAVAIVVRCAEAVQKLVEAMEHRASQWWKNKTGVDTKSACFSVNYRHTRGGMKGLPVAHVDAIHVAEWFKPGGAFPPMSMHHAEKVFGMEIKDALQHVVVTFNEWINAGPETIVELPLTVMDTTTLDKKDLELAWVQAMLDSKMVRWSEAHRWYYRNLQPGDGYMFITSPHEGPEHSYSGTPHSAFRFIRKKNATASRPRQSFEFRCLVVDKNWTSPAQLFKHDVPKAPTLEQAVRSSANSIMTGMVMDSKHFMESMQDSDDMINEKSLGSQPKPPDSLTTPPGDAVFTESGLAYKVITAGTGQKNTGARVTRHSDLLWLVGRWWHVLVDNTGGPRLF